MPPCFSRHSVTRREKNFLTGSCRVGAAQTGGVGRLCLRLVDGGGGVEGGGRSGEEGPRGRARRDEMRTDAVLLARAHREKKRCVGGVGIAAKDRRGKGEDLKMVRRDCGARSPAGTAPQRDPERPWIRRRWKTESEAVYRWRRCPVEASRLWTPPSWLRACPSDPALRSRSLRPAAAAGSDWPGSGPAGTWPLAWAPADRPPPSGWRCRSPCAASAA